MFIMRKCSELLSCRAFHRLRCDVQAAGLMQECSVLLLGVGGPHTPPPPSLSSSLISRLRVIPGDFSTAGDVISPGMAGIIPRMMLRDALSPIAPQLPTAACCVPGNQAQGVNAWRHNAMHHTSRRLMIRETRGLVGSHTSNRKVARPFRPRGDLILGSLSKAPNPGVI